MPVYKYHRMANNSANWTAPTGGRLGITQDYVGQNGFAHEDWNFNRDIWSDGKHHLYLQGVQREDLVNEYNIVLGFHTSIGHKAVGLLRNASFEAADLSNDLWLKRARQVVALADDRSLSEELCNLNDEGMVNELRLGNCLVAVKPEDLVVLDVPLLIPNDIVRRNYHRYQLTEIEEYEFDLIFDLVENLASSMLDIDESFSEGALVERSHKRRERNSAGAREAKENFRRLHGTLHCEACGWNPIDKFEAIENFGTIIEAHHDVPLSASEHSGITHPEDFKMLCPNCHRAIHRIRPWITVKKFKQNFYGSK